MLKKQHFYKIEEIIEYIKTDLDFGDTIDLYALEGDELVLGTDYWVDDGPDFDDEDNEIYPLSVSSRNLEFIYNGQLLAGVIDNTLYQKPDASMKDLVDALNYYYDNDTFMSF